MAVETQGGIKSIQRGKLTMLAGVVSATATISQVVPENTVIRFLGFKAGSLNGDSTRLWIQNSTTIGAVKDVSAPGDTTVSYEIVEFF